MGTRKTILPSFWFKRMDRYMKEKNKRIEKVKQRNAKQNALPVIRDTFIDKIVGYVDPVRGVRRRQARMIMAVTSGYKGAGSKRRALSEYNPAGGSADADITQGLEVLRERSRDLVQNNPIAGGAVSTAVNNVVGTGLMFKAQIDRKILKMTEEEELEFEDLAERGFRVWSGRCDIERTLSFYEIQELAFRSTLESGDVFILLPFLQRPGDAFGLKLQVIEGDRVCNKDNKSDFSDPKLRGGVQLDDNGAPIAYHIMKHHPGDYGVIKREWDVVNIYTQDGRRRILHLFRKIRPGQRRGLPYLAPVIEPLKQLERYTDAELMAAVISSMFTVFIKTETGEGLGPMAPTDETGGTTSDEDYKLAPGAILELGTNDSIDTADPKRPNDKFDPFVLAILRQVGMALEMPYEILIKHFTSSYSAARAAILDAWRFFLARRAWLVRQLCEPVYEAWMYEAVSRGYLYAPGFYTDPIIRAAYLGAKWIGPTQGQIDPVKEVSAAEKRLSLRLTTRSEECAGLTGTDWEQKVPQIKHEQEVLNDIGGDSSSAPDETLTDNPDKEDEEEMRDGFPLSRE